MKKLLREEQNEENKSLNFVVFIVFMRGCLQINIGFLARCVCVRKILKQPKYIVAEAAFV